MKDQQAGRQPARKIVKVSPDGSLEPASDSARRHQMDNSNGASRFFKILVDLCPFVDRWVLTSRLKMGPLRKLQVKTCLRAFWALLNLPTCLPLYCALVYFHPLPNDLCPLCPCLAFLSFHPLCPCFAILHPFSFCFYALHPCAQVSHPLHYIKHTECTSGKAILQIIDLPQMITIFTFLEQEGAKGTKGFYY